MPIQSTTYNSRVTSEALEKKFRDTFTSQGGAELVDDLYAAGVIVPTVDFTAAALGSEIPSFMQQAWDASTGYKKTNNTTDTLITTPGFWKIDLTATGSSSIAEVRINTGLTTKTVWFLGLTGTSNLTADGEFFVFLRSGDSLEQRTNAATGQINTWYRQVADVNGNLVNPLGFTFS